MQSHAYHILNQPLLSSLGSSPQPHKHNQTWQKAAHLQDLAGMSATPQLTYIYIERERETAAAIA